MRWTFALPLILLAGCTGKWERPTWEDFVFVNFHDGKTKQEWHEEMERIAENGREAEATYNRERANAPLRSPLD